MTSPSGSWRLRSPAVPDRTRKARLVLTTALGDRYRVKVSDDGAVVSLWRRCLSVQEPPGSRQDTTTGDQWFDGVGVDG